MMMNKSILCSLLMMMVLLGMVQGESVAELRRVRALGYGTGSGHHYGGDNGRDHPQNYPQTQPEQQQVAEVSYFCRMYNHSILLGVGRNGIHRILQKVSLERLSDTPSLFFDSPQQEAAAAPAPSATTTASMMQESNGGEELVDSKLSTGALAGILVAALCVLLLPVFAYLLLKRSNAAESVPVVVKVEADEEDGTQGSDTSSEK